MHAAMRGKAVVTARVSAVVLPQRAGAVRHVELVSERFIQQLLAEAVAREHSSRSTFPMKALAGWTSGNALVCLRCGPKSLTSLCQSSAWVSGLATSKKKAKYWQTSVRLVVV